MPRFARSPSREPTFIPMPGSSALPFFAVRVGEMSGGCLTSFLLYTR